MLAYQSSVLGPLLYLLYTADLQTTPNIATDNAITATNSDPAIGSMKMHTILVTIKNWLKLRINANESKSVHITFGIQEKLPPPPPFI
jgi:hypothetical protein